MIPLTEDTGTSQGENPNVGSHDELPGEMKSVTSTPSKRRRRSIPASYIYTPRPDTPYKPRRAYSLMRQSSLSSSVKRRRGSLRATGRRHRRSKSPSSDISEVLVPAAPPPPSVPEHPPVVAPSDPAPLEAVSPPRPIDSRSPYSYNFESSFDPRSSTYQFIHSVIRFSEPVLPRLDFLDGLVLS
ncbi:hypothetical protein FRB93_010267 [Tulasnella sp. JGI-2019a]|nr:hypothetical protein FRB93_010267 [Tulasnella sp. JGI-2019a]